MGFCGGEWVRSEDSLAPPEMSVSHCGQALSPWAALWMRTLPPEETSGACWPGFQVGSCSSSSFWLAAVTLPYSFHLWFTQAVPSACVGMAPPAFLQLGNWLKISVLCHLLGEALPAQVYSSDGTSYLSLHDIYQSWPFYIYLWLLGSFLSPQWTLSSSSDSRRWWLYPIRTHSPWNPQ